MHHLAQDIENKATIILVIERLDPNVYLLSILR
jgi:hypothetical protein